LGFVRKTAPFCEEVAKKRGTELEEKTDFNPKCFKKLK
jgi:hypothetical protein